ncbi:hypothetical protein M201_gp80 [Haloarcula californiae tailed virus 2]|uniref:VWFA domain-containing protein n=1 Tax=Haloarcula californiae tailed virus 2 TaxID=1273747 RepID=R4THQ9_9CAUD|nr:hypothetical protein M201_gp80 [Haloarcula californiae tailed virus 2]AGM11846.1 hypothetical protein HCTV2_79 [Haloarcula californiae tailed virus 2]
MKQTKALRRMLEDMTAVYSQENEKTEVCFTTGTPHASEQGGYRADCGCDASGQHVAVATNVRDTYGKSMDGANELRVLVDTLNHEMEHVNTSDLTAKREFAARYPDCPDFAGLVLNVLEDQYIDWQRLARFRGLRSAHSFKVDAIMANGSRRPPLYNLEQSEQVPEGFLQMAFAGYVKGFSDAEREVQEAIVKCRPLVDLVRNEHDPLEREQIAHTCMSILLEAVPDPEDADDYTDENSEDMPTDEPAEVDPEDIQDMLDNLEPEDLEQDEAEDAPSVAIDPDEFDVPEWLEDEMEEADGSEQEVTSAPEQEDDPWADEDAQGGADEGDEQEQEDEGEGTGDGEGEQGEQDTPEQEQPGEQGEGEDGEGSDTSSEGEQQDSQEGGDDTEGSTGQQGDRGEQQPSSPDMNTQPGSPDQPEQEVGGDGERDEDSTASGVDPIEDGIREMEKKERQRDAGDHWNAGDNDYQAPDQEFERRYQRIEREVQQEQTELGQQKRRREQRMQDHRERSSYERRKDSAEKIRELLRSDGTAEDIVEAFKKFKTQDRWLPDTRGERLNTRNATRRLAGDYSEDRVYDRKLKAEVGDRCVGVAMDLSGSMKGVNNLRKPKMALGALHLATKTIGDDLLATGYKTYENHPQKGDYEPVLDLITGPQEGFDWEHLDAAKAGMYTPTADGVMYTLDLLKKSHRREKVMVVITDGKANIPLGGGTSTSSSAGKRDAKKAVNTARQEGVKVLGMAVGRIGEAYMDEVFGAGKWVETGSDTLTQDLVSLYKSEMRTGGQRH